MSHNVAATFRGQHKSIPFDLPFLVDSVSLVVSPRREILAVKQQFPTVGFFFRGQGVVLGSVMLGEGRRGQRG